MTNRRRFLGFGLAASLWPVGSTLGAVLGSAPASVPLPARPHAAPHASGLYRAVCDRRYAAAAGFGAAMLARGVPIHGIDGDVTSLWYHDLALRWREAPVAIAGLTARSALFCLEQLAWDHRMRVVLRAEAVAGPGARAEMRIAAPEPLLANAAVREAGASDLAGWAAQCAALAAHGPVQLCRSTRPIPLRGSMRPIGGDGGAWAAWVIAPIRRS